MNKKLTVVGGAGHIGLPLSLVFANSGIDVICYDNNEKIINECKKGKIHFKAPGASLKSFVAPIPEPEISGNSKKYIAQSHRVLMEVLITEEECIDTKSSKKSSHKVKVSIKPKSETDFNIFEGCGS